MALSVHVAVFPSELRQKAGVSAGNTALDDGIDFSIADLKGNDLIVSTSRASDARRPPDTKSFSVSFRFYNHLLTGKYLLVAAMKNRQHSNIHCYKYIEGAHYFSSLCDARQFGQNQPPIEQKISIH